MKIILLQNDNKLGKKGDIKDVSDGFARNFLIPKNIAVAYSEQMEQTVINSSAKKQKAKINPKALMGKLKAITLVFEEKADENGTFFAGISKEKISKELIKKGISIHPKKIVLSSPIKKESKTIVQINVDSGIKSEIKIITNAIT